EFRGYRRLQYGPALKPYQRIGAFMIAPLFLLLGVGLVISCIFLPRMAADEVNSIWFGAAMIPLGIVMACVGIAFAVFGFKLLKRVFRP
ncbi:MAG TPA: hypothetical protein VG897_03575, partial [Terriglobales bacterium]|nr:hypothetical protein [Terriglobales bacterium]